MMKTMLLTILLFAVTTTSVVIAAKKNSLTINSNNKISTVNVGDKIANIREMKGDIKINVFIMKNATPSAKKLAEEGIKKVNSLVATKNLKANIRGNGEITYRKDLNKMYLRDYRTSNLTEVNCYTGRVKYLGKVVSNFNTPRKPIIPRIQSETGPSCKYQK